MKLIDKLRAADGPDRELDAEIYCAFAGTPCELVRGYLDELRIKQTGTAVTWSADDISPHYTASIDAALALVAEKLPGWKHHDYSYDADDNVYRHQYVLHHEKHTRGTLWVSESHPKSQAIALLLALLTALGGESA